MTDCISLSALLRFSCSSRHKEPKLGADLPLVAGGVGGGGWGWRGGRWGGEEALLFDPDQQPAGLASSVDGWLLRR